MTPNEACAHPNWVMGRKISVDSATMMNKGLEVIEAHWLFGASRETIEVVIHPESVIHSLVEYVDGSVLAQPGNPDMRTPIAQALAFPDRIEAGVNPLDLARHGPLTFEAPDHARFPCLALAFDALAASGTAPATLNAANEVAVAGVPRRAHSLHRHRARVRGGPRAIAGATGHHARRRARRRRRGTRHRARMAAAPRRTAGAGRLMDILQKLLAFLVVLGVLVVFHELGHFWVARLVGVKVLRFSVGFGRVLWSRRFGPDRTEWALSAIPLGGYVKMADEREGDVAPADLPRAFNRQSVGKRIAIVAAGPLANLLLAVLLFAGTYVVGVPGQLALLASPPAETPAAAAGVRDGDLVTAVDGVPVRSWQDLRWRLLHASGADDAALTMQRPDGSTTTRIVSLSTIAPSDWEGNFMPLLGLNADLGHP